MRCTVTDEGSPPTASLTAVRTFAILCSAAEPPRLPLWRELSDCIKDLSSTTEGEITRGCCLHQGVDEHRVKKRSFAFALVYIKCFRTYSVYLSFRHGVLILYRRATLPPRRSCFGYLLSLLRTASACLSRCTRHRRRSKANPLRRSRGG